MAIAVALTQTAIASESASQESGFITGTAWLLAPPTPPLVIYAVDSTTGNWASVETEERDEPAPFSLEVPPGTYQVFGCRQTSEVCSMAFQENGTLSTVSVAAGETVTDIGVGPSGFSPCGSTFALPASPDGRFGALEGPTEVCLQAEAAGLYNQEGVLWLIWFQERQELMDAMGAAFGVEIEKTEVRIDNSWSGQTGIATQLTARGNGSELQGPLPPFDTLKSIMEAQGYTENLQAPTCLGIGGAGPGSIVFCYTKEDRICNAFVSTEPVDDEVCNQVNQDEPCLDQLAPEQKMYTAQLTCALGFDSESVGAGELSKQIRINFKPGTPSATFEDTLPPSGIHDYVFYALAGQEMTVELMVLRDGVATYDSTLLQIGGLDSTRLAVDYTGTQWTGTLPSTQDYYVDVVSIADAPVDYTLYVYISPTEDEAQASSDTGNVSGAITYPDQNTPPLHIVAYNQDDGIWRWVGTDDNATTYSIVGLPPGNYQLVAYTESGLVAGYGTGGVLTTFAVPVGETTTDIDLVEWYEPGTVSFPDDPVSW